LLEFIDKKVIHGILIFNSGAFDGKSLEVLSYLLSLFPGLRSQVALMHTKMTLFDIQEQEDRKSSAKQGGAIGLNHFFINSVWNEKTKKDLKAAPFYIANARYNITKLLIWSQQLVPINFSNLSYMKTTSVLQVDRSLIAMVDGILCFNFSITNTLLLSLSFSFLFHSIFRLLILALPHQQ
jgi:hypothetical protein